MGHETMLDRYLSVGLWGVSDILAGLGMKPWFTNLFVTQISSSVPGYSVSYVALLFLLYLQMVSLICVDGNTREQMLRIAVMRLFGKKLPASQAWKMIWIERMDADECEFHLLKHREECARSQEQRAWKVSSSFSDYWEATGLSEEAGNSKLMKVSVSLENVCAFFCCNDTQAWFLESMKYEKEQLVLLDMFTCCTFLTTCPLFPPQT